MSKLIDELNRTAKGGPQAMGFRAGRTALPKPRMLLIASLTQADGDDPADCITGADAGLLPISGVKADTMTLQGYSRTVPDIPWGGWLRDTGRRKTGLKGVDCDFIVFPVDTPLGVLQDTEAGKILEVEASISEGLLKTIDKLPLDAVLIVDSQRDDSLLTWQHLMLVQHFTASLAKPLLIQVPAKVTAAELGVLWEAGVDGVIVTAGTRQPPEALRKLRRVIDKLVLPARRRQGITKALLPQVTGETSEESEEEEEE